jgi:hypothetical protein
MKANTTNKNFTLNFFDKKICGSKKAFAMANQGSGDAYDELVALMTAHPSFGLEVIKAKSNSSKTTYEGLKFEFMKSYIALQENSALLLKKMDCVIDGAKKSGVSPYPVTKSWFLKTFGKTTETGEILFNVKEAEQLIKTAREAKILAAVDEVVAA